MFESFGEIVLLWILIMGHIISIESEARFKWTQVISLLWAMSEHKE